MEVEFKTKGRRGRQEKTIRVISNDPDEETVILKVSAEIVVDFGFEPDRLYFGRQTKAKPFVKSAVGFGEKIGEIEELSFEWEEKSHAPFYDVTITNVGSGKDKKVTLEIRTTDAIPVGRFRDALLVKTNLKPEPYRVYISGDVLGLVEVLPRSAILRQDKESEPYRGFVTLQPTNGAKFNVLSAVCDDPRVSVKINPPDDKGAVKVELSVTGDFNEERLQSQLHINTDVTEGGDFDLPVYTIRHQVVNPYPQHSDYKPYNSEKRSKKPDR